MKPEILPSGSYRYTKTYKGRKLRATFDHKPTNRELMETFNELLSQAPDLTNKGTFEQFANKYMDVKENVLSPSTIRGYDRMLRNFPESFKALQLSDIGKEDVQAMINEYAVTHSPKSCKNASSLITSVMSMFRPSFSIAGVSLPKRMPVDYYIPKADEVSKILKYVEGTDYEVPFHLGCYGLRRSEICALTIDDVEGNVVHIHKAKVQDRNNKYIVKESTKNESSTRDIVISNKLAKKIKDQGYIFNQKPSQLIDKIQQCQKDLGITKFRLHDLRHFFVTELFDANVPEADIIHVIGHKTDYTTKKVYRHSRMADSLKAKEAVSNLLESKLNL